MAEANFGGQCQALPLHESPQKLLEIFPAEAIMTLSLFQRVYLHPPIFGQMQLFSVGNALSAYEMKREITLETQGVSGMFKAMKSYRREGNCS